MVPTDPLNARGIDACRAAEFEPAGHGIAHCVDGLGRFGDADGL